MKHTSVIPNTWGGNNIEPSKCKDITSTQPKSYTNEGTALITNEESRTYSYEVVEDHEHYFKKGDIVMVRGSNLKELGFK